MCDDFVINESEKKRLKSLKQKRKTFKLQKQTIQLGLQSIDANRSNKKIVFDDNCENLNSTKNVEKRTKTANNLFNSEDENEEQFQWNEEELNAKDKLKQKLFKLKTNISNDKRFALDERFIDKDDEADDNKNKNENENENDQLEVNEKKWQLNILENVLGKSIKITNNNESIHKKKKMIRYDPTASNHQEYEVNIEKTKEDKPIKKKKKIKEDIEMKNDIPPIPTSKELFYDVSENLVEKLKPTEEFSLLAAFGRKNINNENDKNDKKDKDKEDEDNINSNNNFNVQCKKFQYDSSDTEDEKINEKDIISLSKTTESCKFYNNDDRLFFYDDACFDEARNFFKNQSSQEDDAFKYKRRELREIVRSKIRRNLKKSNPWNKKRVRKVKKY